MDIPDSDFFERGRALLDELIDETKAYSVADYTVVLRRLRDFFDEEDVSDEFRRQFAATIVTGMLEHLPDIDADAKRAIVLREWSDALGFTITLTH